jgi:hypothetical protein
VAYGDDIGVWGNADCKARLLTDPPGGSPSFGPWVDMPGVSSISVKADVSAIEGNGDNETCVDVSRIKHYSGKASFGREAISALKLLVGGTVTTNGTTPNQQTDWTDDTKKLPLIELQWRADQDDGDASDVVRTLHRCRMTSLELGDEFEKATTPSFEFKATRRKSDGKRFSISVRETGTPLVAGAPDTTPPTVTAVTPTDGATGTAVSGIVTFTFSSNVDPVWASDPGSYYYSNASNGNNVVFGLAYDATNRVATLQPTSNLAATTKHVAGVTRNLRSLTGVRLASQYAIDFTTT